jgi:hypothetical protein
MALLCDLCPLCLTPHGAHTDTCAAPSRERPALDRAALVEAANARTMEAWLRCTRGGYHPKDDTEALP